MGLCQNRRHLGLTVNPSDDIPQNDNVCVVGAIVEGLDLREFKKLYRERGLQLLTKAESRMAVFIRMNMSAKEIAELTSRSVHTVNCIKYSLKKKLCPEGSLENYLNSLADATQSDLENMRHVSEEQARSRGSDS